MKNLLLIFITALPFWCISQPMIGSNEQSILLKYPSYIFHKNTTKEGETYMYSKMERGTYFYYFNRSTGLTDLCALVPNGGADLSEQIEMYNKEYVIISETKWKAYLKNGEILTITLNYSDKTNRYVFYYY